MSLDESQHPFFSSLGKPTHTTLYELLSEFRPLAALTHTIKPATHNLTDGLKTLMDIFT